MAEKPAGITVFGILQIIFGSITILTMILVLVSFLILSQLEGLQEIFSEIDVNLPYTIFTTIVSMLIGITGLVAGINVLRLKSWARKLLLGLAIFVISFGVVNLIVMYSMGISITGNIPGLVLGAVYYGLIIWYFNKKKVKTYFK